jgi:hypothetical protein
MTAGGCGADGTGGRVETSRIGEGAGCGGARHAPRALAATKARTRKAYLVLDSKSVSYSNQKGIRTLLMRMGPSTAKLGQICQWRAHKHTDTLHHWIRRLPAQLKFKCSFLAVHGITQTQKNAV